MFGFVVRAKDEAAARALAAAQPGDEGAEAWLSPQYSTCVELASDGSEDVIMTDYNRTKLANARWPKGRGKIVARKGRAKGSQMSSTKTVRVNLSEKVHAQLRTLAGEFKMPASKFVCILVENAVRARFPPSRRSAG
jgi:hypothetical protein